MIRNQKTRSTRLSSLLVASTLLCSLALPAAAQLDETTQSQHNLFEKFSEVARSAENRGDYSLAVAMYESALDRTNTSAGQEPKLVETLTRIARCYNQLGYYWRSEPVIKRILGVVEPKPQLYNQRVSTAITDFAKLLNTVNKTAEANSYLQLNQVLSSSQAHWSQSKVVGSTGQAQ